MPNNVKVYPYTHIRISGPLTAAEKTAYGGAASLSGASVTGDNVQVGSLGAIETAQINDSVRGGVAVNTTFAPINATTAADSATRTEQGRGDIEVTMDCQVNTETGSTVDKFLKNATGTRLLYVERANSTGKFTAVVDIVSVSSPVPDEAGDSIFTVVMRGNSAQLATWE